jgi:hypothetical protein
MIQTSLDACTRSMNLRWNAAFRRQLLTRTSRRGCRLKAAFRFRGSERKSFQGNLTPARSLRERENRPPAFLNYGCLRLPGCIRSGSKRRLLSPLPAGEGKNEGERLEPKATPEHS